MGTPAYIGTTLHGRFHGVVNCNEKTLDKPLHWKKPRTVFVVSMGDVFHKAVPDVFIDQVFARIVLCSRHTFIVLTKRAGRMRRYLTAMYAGKRKVCNATVDACGGSGVGVFAVRHAFGAEKSAEPPYKVLSNVWVMVSAEDQKRWDERVPHLIKTPAAVRGVSIEPMLGLITMHGVCGGKIDWAIFGAESLGGRAGRECKENWIRGGLVLCKQSGVPAFVKQVQINARISKDPSEWPRSLRVRQWPRAKRE
jgi:protein gp37